MAEDLYAVATPKSLRQGTDFGDQRGVRALQPAALADGALPGKAKQLTDPTGAPGTPRPRRPSNGHDPELIHVEPHRNHGQRNCADAIAPEPICAAVTRRAIGG